MNLGTDKPQLAELQMLRKDTKFYYDLVQFSKSSTSFNTLWLGLLPYTALFTIETHNLLTKRVREYAKSIKLQNEALIRASRTKIKLFEEYDIIELLEWISEYQKTWFIGKHTGFFEWLKRPLRTDLGLYYYESHLICTTHIAYSNIGIKGDKSSPFDSSTMNNISTTAFSFGEGIGRYMGRLYNDLNLSSDTTMLTEYQYMIDDSLLKHKDVRSLHYFSNIFNGSSSPQLNSCLLLLLANINFVHYILRNLTTKSSDIFFKLKYITLYQLVISLGKLRDYFYKKGVFTDRSKNYLNEILGDKELEKIKSQKQLRNFLVHYTIEGMPEYSIDLSARFYGLVDFSLKQTVDDTSDLVDKQISRISSILEEWLVCK